MRLCVRVCVGVCVCVYIFSETKGMLMMALEFFPMYVCKHELDREDLQELVER